MGQYATETRMRQKNKVDREHNGDDGGHGGETERRREMERERERTGCDGRGRKKKDGGKLVGFGGVLYVLPGVFRPFFQRLSVSEF